MFGLVFSILWTVFFTMLLVSNIEDLADWERAFAMLFPIFGLIAIRATWLDWRRRRSLRVEHRDGAAVYVWIEIDGSAHRSNMDPREDWDSDGDGDGDGGGD